MKIIIENSTENPANAIRRAGYHFEKRREGEEMSAARSFGAGGFPRFHAYFKIEGINLLINLHLDQKRPSYSGSSAHSGEYDGEIVAEEAMRIKSILR